MAESAVRRGYQDILVFTGSTRFSNENEFAEAFKQMVKVGGGLHGNPHFHGCGKNLPYGLDCIDRGKES